MAAEDNFELPEESKRVLTECFEKYDKSGNGVLETSELPAALAFAGIFTTAEDQETLARFLDSSGDGKVQISELVDNWSTLAQHSVNGDQLMKAFKKFDLNSDGYIQDKELKILLTGAGEKWSLQEAEACIRSLKKFDTQQDGKFSYPEFVRMLTANVYPFKRPTGVEKDITQDYEKVTEQKESEEPTS
ncbi:calmodulin-like [Watersipora subatra]|uniref:calmodulin-like n=1 Tax=Watersipora subatra TaxID=2589382 RepID=UPI00355C5E1F